MIRPPTHDKTDRQILRLLQQDGRMTNAELAVKIHLSESACLRRVRALEESAVIKSYAALLEPKSAGFALTVFVNITLNHQHQDDLSSFEAAVRRVPEVLECYLMTGDYDYLLHVAAADAEDYERVHRDHLTRLPGVARLQSSIALRTVTRTQALPIY
jgi:Lrp/AsnC family transcriptional regulator, leucine-responsive regulatory protein